MAGNFDKLYPDATTAFGNDERRGIDYTVIKCDGTFKCWHCGEDTCWVELSFEAPLCSEECCTAKHDEWVAACLLAPKL